MRPHTHHARRRTSPRLAHRLVLAAALFATPALAQAPADEADDLPISAITLYRSGVGSFLRQGDVTGDQIINLRFRTDQINDILKSMMVVDAGGGQVEGVTYGSREPLARRLSSFALDLSDNPDRAALLAQLRGALVTVTTSDGQSTGTVLGVETRSVFHDGSTEQVRSLMLVGTSGVKSFDLGDVRSFEISDPQLAEELNKALLAVAEHRADTTKVVEVSFSGQGRRPVVVTYVHETPVWKTSYRLALPEESSGEGRMQGWAIVENTTDEDWSDVRLSLVAGQPVSFVMDLYEPLFSPRPEVPVPTGVAARPRTYDGSMDRDQQAKMADARRELGRDFRTLTNAPAAAPSLSRGGGGQSPFADANELAYADAESAVANFAALGSMASASEAGEVFQYTLDLPVSVERQQSAMLPIINSTLGAQRVSIYSPQGGQGGSAHPMRGVRITNDSDLQFMPGPIAVYDGAAYAGDAQIGHVAAGDDRLLAYAVDLEVDGTTDSKQRRTIQKVRIVRGLLEQTIEQVQETTYTFDNDDEDRDRLIVIEHPKMHGWDYATAKPAESTAANIDRFELAIKAGEAGALRIEQRRTDAQRLQLTQADEASLAVWVRGGQASAAVRDAFREASAKQAAINEVRERIRTLEQERGEIFSDQQRLRENLSVVDRNSDLSTRYLQQLSTQENRIEAIRSQMQSSQELLERRNRELAEYLANLNVE